MIVSFLRFLEQHKIEDKKLAVGVSGGSDSLALVLAAHEELSHLGYEVIALTVDHGLRPSSSKEAQYVAQIMKKFGIKHQILVWDDEKPTTGIEEAARTARYRLLSDWCEKNNCRYLMVAHHQEDQAETFLMRLQRGSGLDGLCGMREISVLKHLQILRPLLNTPKLVMQDYLLKKNIAWVEDESNLSDDFLRCKIRKFLPKFEAQTGISCKIISETMTRLQSSQNLLYNLTEKTLKHCFQNWLSIGYSGNYAQWLDFDPEIQFRLLVMIVKELTGSDYPPRAKSVMALLENLQKSDFKSGTLGGCIVVLSDQKLWITLEKVETVGYNKEIWKEYLAQNPRLKKVRIPYKMRLALLAKKW